MADADLYETAREAHRASGERLAHQIAHALKLMLAAVVVALVVRILFFQPFSIPSGSMSPALETGDYVFVNKAAYGWSRASFPFVSLVDDPTLPKLESYAWKQRRLFGSQPAQGDVIVFVGPRSGTNDYVKRVIARGGDRVSLVAGRVVVNGLAIPCDPVGGRFCRERLPDGRSYVVEDDRLGPLSNFGEIEIPPGYLFVLGDNRGDSVDSRVNTADGGIGLVPEDHVIGRAARIFFSIEPKPGRGVRWNRIGLTIG